MMLLLVWGRPRGGELRMLQGVQVELFPSLKGDMADGAGKGVDPSVRLHVGAQSAQKSEALLAFVAHVGPLLAMDTRHVPIEAVSAFEFLVADGAGKLADVRVHRLEMSSQRCLCLHHLPTNVALLRANRMNKKMPPRALTGAEGEPAFGTAKVSKRTRHFSSAEWV
jgi:hypothetical protein